MSKDISGMLHPDHTGVNDVAPPEALPSYWEKRAFGFRLSFPVQTLPLVDARADRVEVTKIVTYEKVETGWKRIE